MNITLKLAVSVSALGLLAACGGSSSNTEVAADSAATRFQDVLDADANLREQVLGRSGTAFSAIPDVGSATYTGFGAATIAGGDGDLADGVTLRGDLTVTATFGVTEEKFDDDTVTGTITNLQGFTGDALSDDSIVVVDGDIILGGFGSSTVASSIGGGVPESSGLPNTFRTNYAGGLSVDGNAVVVSGNIEGKFYGTRTMPAADESAVWSLQGIDDDGVANVGGEDRVFEIEIVGQN